MNSPAPKTLPEIRDLMRTDLSWVRNQNLLALVLAGGSERRLGARGLKTWNAVELAEELYAAAGGNLAFFVKNTAAYTTSLTRFGLRGSFVGARLIAAVDLSIRWSFGFADGGNGNMRPDHEGALQKVVWWRCETSEAELMAVILGDEKPDKENARRLLEEFGNPRQLMMSMTLDTFEPFRKRDKTFLRLPKTGCEIEETSFCRLFAAVQLAHHYSLLSTLTPMRLEPGALGLESDQLVELLNLRSALDLDVRKEMIKSMRSDPRLAQDFAKLDRLANDAQTSSRQYAALVSQRFERLCERRTWTDPCQILGKYIPYDALLAIAGARIERSTAEPTRLLEVKKLLEHAAQAAMAGPIDSFVEALVKLNLPESYVERAIEEVRRRYTTFKI